MSASAPRIVVCETEHETLVKLAEAFTNRNPAVSDQLLAELDRANVVTDDDLPATTVRMGSTVTFVADGAEPRTVQVVWPKEADLDSGRLSIMTPVGAALIGLSEGQWIEWQDKSGKTRSITVLEVPAPAAVPVA